MDRTPQRFKSRLSYHAARMGNAMRRWRLRSKARWSALKEPRDGYTIIVPLPWQCWELAFIPLLVLKRARRSQCAEVIIAVNATEESMLRRHGQLGISSVVKSFASLAPRIVYCTASQERLARRAAADGVDHWLNLVNAIGSARTRHALLHNPETIVLDPEFCERHFEGASAGNHTFTGIQRDVRYGSEHSADLLSPTALMIDVAAVRSLFSPVDLYQRVRMHDGARIRCDLMCDVQWRLPDASRVLHEVASDQIVNLSPLLSHWCTLKRPAKAFTPEHSSPLPVVPYFRLLHGEPADLLRACESLMRHEPTMAIDGGEIDLSKLDRSSRDRLAYQIELLDRYFSGTETPSMRRYADALADHAQPERELDVPEIIVNQAAPTPFPAGQSVKP